MGIKWIKCLDRSPKESKIVLVTDGHQVGLGFLGFNATYKKIINGQLYWMRPISLDPLKDIIAWAHLPRPPRYKNIKPKRYIYDY